MKEIILSLINAAIAQLKKQNFLAADIHIEPQLTVTRDPAHGDFATNIAMMLAKPANKKPRDVAEKIIAALEANPAIQKVEIAGPGFINFYIAQNTQQKIIAHILTAEDKFGLCNVGENQRIHIEYVSANPTGPLHVGHGRGAAYGASVSNLLRAVGYDVHREYYVNDSGRQMRNLALSVWLRYLEQQGEVFPFPENAYLGQYIRDIANELYAQYQGRFLHPAEAIQKFIKNDIKTEPEKYLDDLVTAMDTLLGKEAYEIVFQAGLQDILNDIRDDLSEFGVDYDEWFLESSLFKNGLVKAGIELLEKHGHVFEQEGAKWFRSTQFGDEKDRVLVRANGVTTYFASDVAYHLYKYQQGYDRIIDVFGADHHGFIPRLNAFLTALGEDPKKMQVLLVQFAILYRGDEKISMSTRKGEFVTLRELRDEVGNDAARYFYIMRKPEQHLDFDLELAKSKTNENPVFYIQYAYARICSVWRQLEASEDSFDKISGLQHVELLSNEREMALLKTLAKYPEELQKAGTRFAPHLLAGYLHELAGEFHSYYNAEKFLISEANLRNARLCLIKAVQQVLKNGLMLLGVSAPEKM